MKRSLFLILVFLQMVCCKSPALAVEKQLIAGAGPSTKIVQVFFEKFAENPAASGYKFLVPERSAKHAGGIKSSNDFLFGRTGRPLNSSEKKLNKDEIFLAKVPVAFSLGSEVGLTELTFQQLEDLYSGRITNWLALGGPDAEVVLVGREQTEALFTTLKEAYPFFDNVHFSKTFKKDHQVVNFLKSPQGRYAIGFGAKPNFSELNILKINGMSAGVNVGLVYDLKSQNHSLVAAAKKYAASDEWRNEVIKAGLLPVE